MSAAQEGVVAVGGERVGGVVERRRGLKGFMDSSPIILKPEDPRLKVGP